MSNSIRLSPRHGVNPTIGRCFFCGKETGEIGLLGKLRKDGDNDAEAPMYSVLSYDPCPECAAGFAKGVACIGVVPASPDGRPPIRKEPNGAAHYPTGNVVVLTEDAFSRIFGMDQSAGSPVLMDDAVVCQLYEMHREAAQQAEAE